MPLIDNRGRLFGKVSILDIGAVLVVLVALSAIFFFPGSQSSAVAPIGGQPNQAVEVEVALRGLNVRSLDVFKPGSKANVIIRNQPYGEVEIVNVEDVTTTYPVSLPDGKIEEFTKTAYFYDVVLTVAGKGMVKNDGVVLGNTKIKTGVPLELETFDYLVRGMVMDVRMLEEPET
jgi:hypothetical protein